jgi:hypothetical protein
LITDHRAENIIEFSLNTEHNVAGIREGATSSAGRLTRFIILPYLNQVEKDTLSLFYSSLLCATDLPPRKRRPELESWTITYTDVQMPCER